MARDKDKDKKSRNALQKTGGAIAKVEQTRRSLTAPIVGGALGTAINATLKNKGITRASMVYGAAGTVLVGAAGYHVFLTNYATAFFIALIAAALFGYAYMYTRYQ